MQTFIDWAQSTWISAAMLDLVWAWPTAEILHFLGMSLLFGAILIVDLRLIGFFRSIDIAVINKLLPWALIGFGINLVTGVCFFLGDPTKYATNPLFAIKMVLIVVAGLNALFFYWRVVPAVSGLSSNDDTPVVAKATAGASIGVWLGVLLCGRLLPYLGGSG